MFSPTSSIGLTVVEFFNFFSIYNQIEQKMKNQKISKKELVDFITSEALKIKAQLNEEFQKASEPKMDRVANPSDKDQALVMKTKKTSDYKKGPGESSVPYTEDHGLSTELEMNANDSDQGTDGKVAAAVSVKAGAAKGGNKVTSGQHNANFTSKTDSPKKDASKPFVEKGKEKMNTLDKENYPGGAKTFVEAGAEMKGNDVRTGMHKGKFSEKAPDSDKDERIAHGIELKESYTKKELYELIMNESKKLAKKMILKNELNKLRNDLNGL